MLITHEKLREINQVQTRILAAVSEVCKQLGIVFFVVHGSLLGAVRNQGFIPDDDDIDVAMLRADYERFLREAPALLPPGLFAQDQRSDENYPMEFAKVRDPETAYIVETAKNIQMDHGIYIDVFPIDYEYKSRLRGGLTALRHRLMNTRIAEVFSRQKPSGARRAAGAVLRLLWPDLRKTVIKRNALYSGRREQPFLRLTGGKKTELRMPAEWFRDPVPASFEGVDVYLPGGYDAYLTRIYGDYARRTLIEKKYADAERIEVNACVVDTERSYRNYLPFRG